MTSARIETDLGVGLAMVFGALALFATVATAATGYSYALDGSHAMQLFSGVSLALAIAFGAVGIAAMHVYAE